MNAWRPQSQEMSEQYNWEGLGVTDAKTIQALQVIIDTLNGPGSLLGTSYKFATFAPSIINAPNTIKERATNGKWSSQSFGDYFFENINTKDIETLVESVMEIVSDFGRVGKYLSDTDPSIGKLAAAIDIEQNSILQESASNVGGYVSQVLTNQGGFTIAAGVEIENAIGSAFDDSITGNFLSNVLQGRQGNDSMFGLQGDDIIGGDQGDDIIDGGVGSDEMWGGEGRNTFLSAVDGFADKIIITAEQSVERLTFDVIEGLDSIDEILIYGSGINSLSTSQQSVDGLSGVGIFVDGNLEAIYTGGALSSDQILNMTSIYA
jgi:Ca2+-binding RTX toxin-like protein